jgi:type III pantothenate kinase
MILVVDIGNTHTVVGISQEGRLIQTWRVMSSPLRTEDEIGTQLSGFFNHHGFSSGRIEGMGISSVVPDLTAVYQAMGRKYLRLEPLTIDAGLDLGMRIRYQNPYAVGADRLCNAVAGKRKYGIPLIIIDFGTATTFDVIDTNGDYSGGVIAPGIETSIASLHRKAAKLPHVELDFPKNVIGITTEQSIQSGILYGSVHLINGLIKQIQDSLGEKTAVVATGGLAEVIARHTDTIEMTDPNLSLEGIVLIYEKNKQRIGKFQSS